MTIQKQIEAARNEVRKHKFGTVEYDLAFEAMGKLTRQAAEADKSEYKSIDGDIFAPR